MKKFGILLVMIFAVGCAHAPRGVEDGDLSKQVQCKNGHAIPAWTMDCPKCDQKRVAKKKKKPKTLAERKKVKKKRLENESYKPGKANVYLYNGVIHDNKDLTSIYPGLTAEFPLMRLIPIKKSLKKYLDFYAAAKFEYAMSKGTSEWIRPYTDIDEDNETYTLGGGLGWKFSHKELWVSFQTLALFKWRNDKERNARDEFPEMQFDVMGGYEILFDNPAKDIDLGGNWKFSPVVGQRIKFELLNFFNWNLDTDIVNYIFDGRYEMVRFYHRDPETKKQDYYISVKVGPSFRGLFFGRDRIKQTRAIGGNIAIEGGTDRWGIQLYGRGYHQRFWNPAFEGGFVFRFSF